LLFLVFVALLGLAALRAVWIGTISSGKLSKAATTQQVQNITVPAPRGSILDRNGVELAVSETADDVIATPYLVKHKLSAASRLAPVLGMDRDKVLARLSHRGGFVYVDRLVSAGTAAEVQKLKIDGISLIPRERRTYPRAWLASQLLGHVGTDGDGLSGLEYRFDKELRGSDGQRHIVSDALGQPIEVRDTTTTKPGETVKLTVDAAIQEKVEEVLQGVGQTYRPKGATAIVMDPRTSRVLAMANWPRINDNDPSAAPSYAGENRAVGFTYEPGSTFKAITVAGALQQGLVSPSTPFDLPVELQVADRTIHDAEARGPERLTVAQILAQSSNVGADLIGAKLGAVRFDQWVHRFGFGKPTGIDLPGEEQGIVLHHQQYSGSSMGNLPIGQGESVTPIQMATAYSAIANGGILRPARIVDSIGGNPVPVARGHRVINAGVAASLRHMLEGVLAEGGTAHEAAIPGYALAGKTGTANKVDTVHGGYSNSAYVASFMGFAPARDPRLLVAVVVDEPQGAIYGGAVAAPAFQKIVAFALPYLRIPPK
ncbi:MAG TPA: penicillin-binding protein 2, partial [Solirubrobacteraceae bacterium]